MPIEYHALMEWSIPAARQDYAAKDGILFARVGAGIRYTAPVEPGAPLETAILRTGDGGRFRTRIVERDIIALDQGWIHFG